MKNIRKVLALTLVIVLCLGSVSVFATPNVTSPEDYLFSAIQDGGYVSESLRGNSAGGLVVSLTKRYDKESGGFYVWSELVGTGAGSFNDAFSDAGISRMKFDQLTSKAQKQFVEDFYNICQYEYEFYAKYNFLGGMTEEDGIPTGEEEAQAAGLNSDVATRFYNDCIVTHLGITTASVNAMMGGMKPDFISANKTMSGAMGVFNTLLGILGILLMSFLGLTLMLDLAYIALPAFRNFLAGGGENGGGDKKGMKIAQLVSDEAVAAVKMSTGDKGDEHSPVLTYLKKKWIALLFFMILLVALISGRLFDLIGTIINLTDGFFS